MILSQKAVDNLKDYDLYVKIVVDEVDCIEYQICNNSDDMVDCDNIWSIKLLNHILENWGVAD